MTTQRKLYTYTVGSSSSSTVVVIVTVPLYDAEKSTGVLSVVGRRCGVQVAPGNVVYLAEPTAAARRRTDAANILLGPRGGPCRAARRGAVKPTTTSAGKPGRPGAADATSSNAHRPPHRRTPHRMRQICPTVRLTLLYGPNLRRGIRHETISAHRKIWFRGRLQGYVPITFNIRMFLY